MTPYLTEVEIAAICEPLIAPSAQIRYFKKLGMLVNRKPNGKALVARSEFKRVLVGNKPDLANSAKGLNTAALLHLFQGKRHGP